MAHVMSSASEYFQTALWPVQQEGGGMEALPRNTSMRPPPSLYTIDTPTPARRTERGQQTSLEAVSCPSPRGMCQPRRQEHPATCLREHPHRYGQGAHNVMLPLTVPYYRTFEVKVAILYRYIGVKSPRRLVLCGSSVLLRLTGESVQSTVSISGRHPGPAGPLANADGGPGTRDGWDGPVSQV